MNMMSPAQQMTRDAAPGIRVTMLGLRGFPNVQGGVERHVENLARELSTYYGEPYGHSGHVDELLTIGNTCIPAIQANQNKGPR